MPRFPVQPPLRLLFLLFLTLAAGLPGTVSAQRSKAVSTTQPGPKPAKPAKPPTRVGPPSAPAKPVLPPAPKVEWKPVYYKGRAYVPANQVAAYYDLRSPEVWNKAFTLASADRRFTIECSTGEKRVKLSGWTFYFSFPVVKPKEMPMISVFDVRNVLDPILRPNDRRDPAILRTVVLDPSGGGRDTGIKSPHIAEKDLTLAVAKILAPLLRDRGYQVVLTREEDKTILPGLRVRTANDIADESIFISLRAASGASSLKGFECSTYPPAGSPATNEDDSPAIDKRFFAGNINDRESLALATTIQSSVVRAVKPLDLGIRRTRLEELRDISMPAISCKLGYLSHREEARRLGTRDYQAQLAAAIVQGVDRYAAFLRTGFEERTTENRQRPLFFGPLTAAQNPVPDSPGAETITLRIPIAASPHANPAVTLPGGLDCSRMELQVFLFETVNGAEIDLSSANPPEMTWLSVLPDWQAGVPEWLQLTYLRPPFSLAETKAYGDRSYYGYVARLIYDGRLLDEISSPPNLNRALYYFTPVFPRR